MWPDYTCAARHASEPLRPKKLAKVEKFCTKTARAFCAIFPEKMLDKIKNMLYTVYRKSLKEGTKMCYIINYHFTLPHTNDTHHVTIRGVNAADCTQYFWELYPSAVLYAVDDPQVFDPDEFLWDME